MPVTAAVDVWAVGVIAFELFTRTNWCMGMRHEQVLRAISTPNELPWEATAPEARRARRRCLRALTPHVLACLHRDPEQRPTAAELAAKLDSLYHTTTTTRSVRTGGVRIHPLQLAVGQAQPRRWQCGRCTMHCEICGCCAHAQLYRPASAHPGAVLRIWLSMNGIADRMDACVPKHRASLGQATSLQCGYIASCKVPA